MKSQIKYLNTDLDVMSQRDLTPLAAALDAKGLFTLHLTKRENRRWYATFEIMNPVAPETTIRELLDAVESLRGAVRELWTKCTLREFNIGYDCGHEPWAFNSALTNE